MDKSYLLDTNAVIAHINGDQVIRSVISDADNIFLPSIVLGELYFGAERSTRVEENLKQVEQFASGRTVLSCDKETAKWYARVLSRLASKGRPIPANDVWIAAIAFQHNLTVLTRDSHFNSTLSNYEIVRLLRVIKGNYVLDSRLKPTV